MTSDQVCEEYAEKEVKLTIKSLDDEEDELVLIEGSSESLEFLGNLLLALAKEHDCGRQLGPRVAGSIFFSPESTKGLYIHRLPCEHTESGT